MNRHDIEELLPWRINDTLNDAERKQLDEQIADDSELLRDIEFMSRLRQSIKERPEVSPGEFGLARLKKELSQEKADRVAKRKMRISRFVFGFNLWQVAAVAASVLLVVQTVVLLNVTQEDTGYEALSGGSFQGPVLQVIFVPDATEKEIRAVLDAVEADIVAGPSAVGVYRLRLTDEDRVQEAIVYLGSQTNVVTHVAIE